MNAALWNMCVIWCDERVAENENRKKENEMKWNKSIQENFPNYECY